MNPLRTIRRLAPVAAVAAAALLAGCVTPNGGDDGLYATPIGGAPVTANPTPYSAALVCLGEHARQTGRIAPRIAVGRILDYTGKVDTEGGRRITQGASLMAISAFAKAGARLVERFDTSVSELELKYANNRLISDGGGEGEFRRIFAGQMPGSDFYVVGGITELNYNIRSVGVDGFIGDVDARDTKGTIGANMFVMNIGLDLRLVDTRTLEVVDVISYQKQIIGRELSAGVFTFWDDVLFDVGAGERALEPMQMAVRSATERAVVEMMANLYGVRGSDVCADALRAGGDPLGGGANGSTGSFLTARGEDAAIAADRRAEPRAWHASNDAAMRGAIRGVRFEEQGSAEQTAFTPAEGVELPAEAAPTPVRAASPARRPQRVTRTTTPAPAPAAAPIPGLRVTTGQ